MLALYAAVHVSVVLQCARECKHSDFVFIFSQVFTDILSANCSAQQLVVSVICLV